jgi:hypothetical protein
MNAPMDKATTAYRSFLAVADMIERQGDNTSEALVIEAIDDILEAYLSANDTKEMIRILITGVRTGEIDEFGLVEIRKTREYLAELDN